MDLKVVYLKDYSLEELKRFVPADIFINFFKEDLIAFLVTRGKSVIGTVLYTSGYESQYNNIYKMSYFRIHSDFDTQEVRDYVLSACERLLKSLGVVSLYMNVNVYNTVPRRILDEMGYEPCGFTYRFFFDIEEILLPDKNLEFNEIKKAYSQNIKDTEEVSDEAFLEYGRLLKEKRPMYDTRYLLKQRLTKLYVRDGRILGHIDVLVLDNELLFVRDYYVQEEAEEILLSMITALAETAVLRLGEEIKLLIYFENPKLKSIFDSSYRIQEMERTRKYIKTLKV